MWTEVKYPKWEVGLGASDRVNIHFLMHDTHLCLSDVKMRYSQHGTNKILIQKL